MRISSLIINLLITLLALPIFAGNIHEFVLPNGLKLIVKEDHRTPVVMSSVWYRVGASNEPPGLTGLSHGLEHMMFRGTPTFGPGEFARIIEDNGGEENATTWDDFTNYYEILPADKLPISFELESDRMQHLSLDKQAFEKEIQVVMEERRLTTDDDPQQRTFERFNAVAYTASPYHHSVIGWMDDLQNMQVENLKQWYHMWYAPNNALVLIVGDVKPEEVFALAKRYFGRVQPRALPAIKINKEVEPLGRKEVLVTVPAKLPWLLLGYNVPSLVTAQPTSEAYTLELLAAILNGGDSARLPTKLVRGKQIATTTSADYNLYSHLEGLFMLSAIPAQKSNLQQLEAAILTEVKNLQEKPVTLEELNRAKTVLIAAKVFAQDSIRAQAIEIGTLISVGRSWQDADAYSQRVEAVTPTQIQSVAKKYLTDKNLTVGRLKPSSFKSTIKPLFMGKQ